MAATLEITDGTLTVDLLDDVFKLEAGGWDSIEPEESTAWETFAIIGDDTDSNIRDKKVNLDTLGRKARDYAGNLLATTPVWLNAYSDGETAKRALVYDIKSEIVGDEIFSNPLLGLGTILLRVAVKRKAEWESVTAIDIAISGGTTLPCLGGWSAIADQGGTLPARLDAMSIYSGDAAGQLTKVWLGVREVYNGSTGFTPAWDCTVGTMVAADTTAGGGVVTCTFGVNTDLAERFKISCSQIAAITNPLVMSGKYLILARLKMNTVSDEIRVQLRQGWAGSSAAMPVVSDLYLTGQAYYHLVELGEITIPPDGSIRAITVGLGDFTISIWAERLSVAGSISFDQLIFIPSEHIASVKGADIQASLGSVYLFTSPDDYQGMRAVNAAGVYNTTETIFTDFCLPAGGGILVVAADNDSNSADGPVSDSLMTEFKVYPRWTSFNNTPAGT